MTAFGDCIIFTLPARSILIDTGTGGSQSSRSAGVHTLGILYETASVGMSFSGISRTSASP